MSMVSPEFHGEKFLCQRTQNFTRKGLKEIDRSVYL